MKGMKSAVIASVVLGTVVATATSCRSRSEKSCAFRVVPQRHGFFRPAWCGWYGSKFEKYEKAIKGLESFENMVGQYNLPEIVGKDGKLCYDWEALRTRLPVAPDKEMLFRVLARAPFNPRRFYTAEFSHDRTEFEKWRKEHPGWLGFFSYEWGNDAYQHIRKPASMLDPGRGDKSITSNDLARILRERPKPNTRQEFVENLLRPVFDRVVEWGLGDPADMLLGEGHYCIEHLAGYWGAGKLGIETTRDYMFWQNQMMFCRGAARQFSIPWMWYIASYIGGSVDGKYVNATLYAENHPTAKYHGPNYGISLSSMKRVTYLTYLSGANWYEREGMGYTHFLHSCEPMRLSEEGKMYDAFYSFTKRFDRGTPYAPVALLVPANRGYSRLGGKAFGICDYTRPDYMLDALMSVILEFPKNRLLENRKNHVERVMANSRYGDVFDVLTPDFPKQDSFRAVIGDYSVAILVGEYGENAEMESILRSYVDGGGVLVLNAKQLTSGFPASFTGVRTAEGWKDGARSFTSLEPVSAKVVRSDASGRAVFTSNKFGKGRVIVCAEDWLVPWYGDDEAGQERALKDTQLGEPVHYPDIEWLLGMLEEGFLPVKVHGDVQYGINKTPAGWSVYLINNGGVRKEWDKPQEIAAGGEEVEIDVSAIPHSSVVEHVAGDSVRVDGDRLRVSVPNGDIRVVEIR